MPRRSAPAAGPAAHPAGPATARDAPSAALASCGRVFPSTVRSSAYDSPPMDVTHRRAIVRFTFRADPKIRDDSCWRSERDVAVLLGRVGVALVLQHVEGADHASPRLARVDHVV